MAHVTAFEFSERLYRVTYDEARLLAEKLRNYAKGTFPSDIALASQLSGNPNWTDGALAVADCIEDVLVDRFTGPVPLEGKAAEATFWTLRLMQGLGGSTHPSDIAALRDALATRFAARASTSS